jgi:hypothetical protein
VTSPPYPTQFKFRNDGAVPLYVHQGCVGVDYGISSCASGFRDSLGPAFHCACACENTSCTGGVACGACPADTAGTIAAGASSLVAWDAIVRKDEDRGTYWCVRSQPASPGRHRVAIRVYDDATSARDGIGGRLVTQDFELPATGSLVEIPIAAVASDACTMAPTASTPACTGNEAHDQPCQLALSMNYSYEGGLGPYYDTFWLAPPNAYTLTRTYTMSTLATRSCMAPLPICSRDGREVTTADVARVLTAPSVVAAFGTPTPVFGYDSRPTDGRILILRTPDGKSLGIGANTIDKPVPQAMQDVQSVISRLDTQMRATPPCAMLNP